MDTTKPENLRTLARETHISPNFLWRDVVHSDTGERAGIDNTPPDNLWGAILHTVSCMEMVRTKILRPILVDSFYRCLTLNALVGSHYTSQHLKCEAVDWVCPEFGTPYQICHALIPFIEELGIDQLILEHTWIHSSFCADPHMKPRGMVISLLASGGYAPGLTDKFGKSLTV